jgi:hypothetical protein
MTKEEYNILFHKEQLNLVAFKRLMDCDEEVLRLVNRVIQTEREAVANWLMRKGFATGHGDAVVDMLDELEWQVAEKEREECLKRASIALLGTLSTTTDRVLNAIRRRGQE